MITHVGGDKSHSGTITSPQEVEQVCKICFSVRLYGTGTSIRLSLSSPSVQMIVYGLLLLAMTIALVMAANLIDPSRYELSYSDALRGMCEIITLSILSQYAIVQINGIR